MWEVARALGGQVRIVAGMGGGGIAGLDMTAALALGRASGCDEELLAAILPEVEAAIVSRNADTGDQPSPFDQEHV